MRFVFFSIIFGVISFFFEQSCRHLSLSVLCHSLRSRDEVPYGLAGLCPCLLPNVGDPKGSTSPALDRVRVSGPACSSHVLVLFSQKKKNEQMQFHILASYFVLL